MSQNPLDTPGQSGQPNPYPPAGGDPAAGSVPSSAPSAGSPYGDPSATSASSAPSAADPSGYPQYGTPGYGDQAGYGQQPQQPYSAPSAGYPQQGYTDPNAGYPQQGYPQAPQAGYTDPNAGYPPQQYAQPGYPQQPYAAAGQAPVSEGDEKTWAIISHISIPFFGFIGPLIAYLVYKDRSPWLKQVTTEALNFGILVSIVYIISGITSGFVIGLILYPLAWIGALILCIMATMAASRHEFYKYPVNVRMIK